MDTVYKYLTNTLNICDKDTIVAAISYGPDSMVLLNLLIELRKEKKNNLICAHVNHNLRSESTDEEKLLRDYCEKNDVIFECHEIDFSTASTLTEAAARNIRYNFFDSIIKKYNANYLMTAHHGDDLIETVLMRIVRGSTLGGYSGFNKITDKDSYKIVRPLLTLTKVQLVKYLNENNISYAIDKTNESEVYTRNRYRKRILPFLKQEDENVHLKFIKYSETLNEYSNYINEIVDEKIKQVFIDNKLNLNLFNKEKLLIKKNIILRILELVYRQDINLIEDRHVDLFLELTSQTRSNISLNFPKNYILRKEYDYVELIKVKEKEGYNLKLEDCIMLQNGMKIEFVDSIDNNSNYMTRLNSKDIKLPLYVRNKKDGDKIIVKGMNKTKKVKDIFIDEKVLLSKRYDYPLVVDSQDTILWIPGIKKSIFDRKENEEYDIILHYIKGEEYEETRENKSK